MAPTMPNAHRGIRNQGLSSAPYQLPRGSPIRAVPKSANNTHTATATNNGPILSERINDLPHPTQTRLYFPASCASGTPGVEQVLRERPFYHLSPLVVFVGRLYCVAMGGGISMPCSAATSMIVLASGWSSKVGGPPSSLPTSSPTSSKKRSYKPPGVWVARRRPTSSPTFLWVCRAPLGTQRREFAPARMTPSPLKNSYSPASTSKDSSSRWWMWG